MNMPAVRLEEKASVQLSVSASTVGRDANRSFESEHAFIRSGKYAEAFSLQESKLCGGI
jgi:hypothetical protein